MIAERNAEYNRTIPTCHTERECELMWSIVRRWIFDNAGQKLQHITDDFMETYNPRKNSPRLAVRVSKDPLLDDSGYRITVTTWCDNLFGCTPDASWAAMDFNKKLSEVKAPRFNDAIST